MIVCNKILPVVLFAIVSEAKNRQFLTWAVFCKGSLLPSSSQLNTQTCSLRSSQEDKSHVNGHCRRETYALKMDFIDANGYCIARLH